jgi:hypothetical protein
MLLLVFFSKKALKEIRVIRVIRKIRYNFVLKGVKELLQFYKFTLFQKMGTSQYKHVKTAF